MIADCIHGVPAAQCASCRTCQHGFVASRCSRCRARVTKLPIPDRQPDQEFEGHEIYFVPAENSWYYRDADANPSPRSYRSAFMARRAVIEASATPGGSKTADGGSSSNASAKKRKGASA